MEQKIRDYCRSLGLDTIGFIPCRQFNELKEFYSNRKEQNLQNEFEEQDIEMRTNPGHYIENAKTIISIAFLLTTCSTISKACSPVSGCD